MKLAQFIQACKIGWATIADPATPNGSRLSYRYGVPELMLDPTPSDGCLVMDPVPATNQAAYPLFFIDPVIRPFVPVMAPGFWQLVDFRAIVDTINTTVMFSAPVIVPPFYENQSGTVSSRTDGNLGIFVPSFTQYELPLPFDTTNFIFMKVWVYTEIEIQDVQLVSYGVNVWTSPLSTLSVICMQGTALAIWNNMLPPPPSVLPGEILFDSLKSASYVLTDSINSSVLTLAPFAPLSAILLVQNADARSLVQRLMISGGLLLSDFTTGSMCTMAGVNRDNGLVYTSGLPGPPVNLASAGTSNSFTAADTSIALPFSTARLVKGIDFGLLSPGHTLLAVGPALPNRFSDGNCVLLGYNGLVDGVTPSTLPPFSGIQLSSRASSLYEGVDVSANIPSPINEIL